MLSCPRPHPHRPQTLGPAHSPNVLHLVLIIIVLLQAAEECPVECVAGVLLLKVEGLEVHGSLVGLECLTVLQSLTLEVLKVSINLVEILQLKLCQLDQELLEARQVQLAALVEVAVQGRQCGLVRDEVVAHQEAHQHPVINDALQVVREGQGTPQIVELIIDVLPHEAQMQQVTFHLKSTKMSIESIHIILRWLVRTVCTETRSITVCTLVTEQPQ
ncbi:hypothetical protein E2C01_024689 [Portunus trituberculatus]|uniref:Secreted protein n=1 Tax=Portunus trituberculatus TaxID=210409 RepID=A0A5B7EB92_PORTR|nr:hypothetical protein [Portunus trituberculatus]